MTGTRPWCSMFSPVDPRVTPASASRPVIGAKDTISEHAANTPQPDATAAIPARTFAGAVLVQSPDADLTDDNAVVIALGTAEHDTMARLRAGEATSLVALTATALGLASCPITEPLEVAETRAAVHADVFGEEAYPQMLLRIGWVLVNADPLPSTPRSVGSGYTAGRFTAGLIADACLVTSSRSMSTCRT